VSADAASRLQTIRADVVVMGGGLAGLTLALQLRQRLPALEIVVLERLRHPVTEAAHKVGVIHRDLKPGNVFVESHPDGQKSIKVIDFGLAKQADRAGGSVRPTNPGTLLGTPAFMAPEQVLGTKVTPATDLYAVGGIAYQMLTNHLPHEAPSAIEVLSQKMQHDPIRPKQWQPTLDDDLDGWVMNLLSREADRRFQDAEEARTRLRRISDGKTVAPGMGGAKPVSQSRTGVVPKRSWGDSKAVTEESHVEKSTDRFQEFRNEPALKPGDETLVPKGTIEPVAGTPFDFTKGKKVGKDLAQTGGSPVGYDHNFVVNGPPAACTRWRA
jgi:serine/threonine protein kinase